MKSLKNPPESLKIIFVYLALLGLVMGWIFFGYIKIGRRLVSGERENLFLPRFITDDQTKDILDVETTDIAVQGLPEPVEMPEGIMEIWDGEGRVTVLIMGLDYRDWLEGSGPSRTDTMMVLTLDPLNNAAGILSIPRDLWVSIPGFENNRINTAYFLGEAYKLPGGGPAMAVKTVEGLLGIQIHYYALVDFGAFVRFIDVLHGVKVNVPERIRIDPIGGNPKMLEPGVQTLPGELALAYARARNTQYGDLDRAIRQQQVVYAIRDRLLNPDSMADLVASAPDLYTELSGGIRTNITLDEVIKLAWLAQRVPDENIKAGAISPNDVNYATTPDGRSVLLPRTEKIRQLRDDIFLQNVGTLGPLSPGSPEDRMIAEGANIRLINSSGSEALANQIIDLLSAKSANVIETVSGGLVNQTRIVDYSGNPHTVSYLFDILSLELDSYDLEFSPGDSLDLDVILGVDLTSTFESH